MSTKDTLRLKLQTASVVEKLIAINVVVFILFFLIKTISFLFQVPDTLITWFVFPQNPSEYIVKPWTIITYSFLHAGIWHILGNMLIFYYAGSYFLTYFSPKKLLNYYFLGVIFGALVYMLSYNLFPVFQGMGNSYLLGASAGIMAVLVGIATKIPYMRIRLMFLGSIKFWWIAAFLVALDVIQIPFDNPGGHLAHLGGALLGYTYTTQLNKGRDIGSGFEKMIDWFLSLFNSEKRRKPKMRTVYKNKTATNSSPKSSKFNNKDEKQHKIDGILDKISKSGYDSLSKEEKDFLFHAGKD